MLLMTIGYVWCELSSVHSAAVETYPGNFAMNSADGEEPAILQSTCSLEVSASVCSCTEWMSRCSCEYRGAAL